MKLYSVLSIFFLAGIIFSQSLPMAEPESVGMDRNRLQEIDTVINQAIADGQTPGAVLLVSRKGSVVCRRAYGYSMLIPEKKKMTVETVFDLASLTKPMATATSAMILIQEGKLRLMDAVRDYIPGFEPWKDPESDKTEKIRIWHLLTHTSGLPPYAPVKELQEQYGAPNPDSLINYIVV
jgi:CubicO group peptidase (beta-lactamase class C family)